MFDSKGQRLDILLHTRICNELKQQHKKFKQVFFQSTIDDCV
jgi:hypothetical protein